MEREREWDREQVWQGGREGEGRELREEREEPEPELDAREPRGAPSRSGGADISSGSLAGERDADGLPSLRALRPESRGERGEVEAEADETASRELGREEEGGIREVRREEP